jgi:hypothetical protein
MSYPTTGTCQCGKVHYIVKKAPIKTVVCHCADCQKISAGAFTMTMLIKREDLEIVRGEMGVFDRPADSGNIARCYFCPTCSNRIYHENPAKPEVVRLKPGTLDDTSIIQPELQVWMKSAQGWLEQIHDLPCHDTQPDMSEFSKDN